MAAPRVRLTRSGTSATAGTSQPQPIVPCSASAKWCSVFRTITYLSRSRYSSHLSEAGMKGSLMPSLAIAPLATNSPVNSRLAIACTATESTPGTPMRASVAKPARTPIILEPAPGAPALFAIARRTPAAANTPSAATQTTDSGRVAKSSAPAAPASHPRRRSEGSPASAARITPSEAESARAHTPR